MSSFLKHLTARIPKEMQGMILAFFGFMFFSLQDALISVTGRTYPPLQVIWLTGVIIFTLLVAGVIYKKGWAGMKAALHTHQLKAHLVRGILLAVGFVLALTSVTHLPLSNFYVIIFMSPLLAGCLSGYVLKERVGFRKTIALLVGFVGVFYALQPEAAGFSIYSLYALGAAIIFGSMAVMSRLLGRKDAAPVLVFYPQLMLIVLFALPTAFVFVPIAFDHIWLVLATGVCSTVAYLLNAQAYKMAPVYLLAPCQFMQFVWGSTAQWVLYGTLPQKSIVFGAALIILSNLFIVYMQAREKAAALKAEPVS